MSRLKRIFEMGIKAMNNEEELQELVKKIVANFAVAVLNE